MAETGPAGMDAALGAAVVRVAQTAHLLVAMDFDGTMAPLVPRAEDARPLPEATAAFAKLARLERTTTALVSGRALSSLRAAADPPAESLLVGSHGAEVWLGPGSPGLALTDAQQQTLRRALAVVRMVVLRHPGTLMEVKPAGVVLHYRQAAPGPAEAAVAQVRELLESEPGLHFSTGKMVLEMSVVKANKGESLELLRAAAGATAVVFAGDDVTDEHGFAALAPGDVGIKVGAGDTAARFRLASPAQVPALLELLLAARH